MCARTHFPKSPLQLCRWPWCCNDDRRSFLRVRCLVRPRKPACTGGSCNVFRGRFTEYAPCAGEAQEEAIARTADV